ncbi:MAG: 4-alpha-glucanotransferase, partial [Gammaproteobacteria bacterium]|nr:4-alpha-glucanotransferase [Gammaproteobacteria bacterium]
LIDIGELIHMGLVTADEAQPLTGLPATTVDYGKLIPIKSALLALAASRFATRASSTLKTAFDEFREQHDAAWLHDYVLFRLLKTRHDEQAWPGWKKRYARRKEKSLGKIEKKCGRQLEALQVEQFIFDSQCRALKDYAADNGILLFGDIPIYIALDSADAWARSEIVRIDEKGRPDFVAGVPPDYYSEDGQLWGNPLYDWKYHDRSGYEWWIDRVRRAMAYTDLVRIDHFRGFEAYWAVPCGEKTARKGTWEPGPGKTLFEALRAALGELPIVAENLGVITPRVEALRNEYGMPGMVILQFDASKDQFSLDDIEENCVVYTGSHDNDTTQGWFNGGPGDIRSRDEVGKEQQIILAQTNGKPETIHWDLIRLAFSSNARIAIVPMQDFLGLGSDARFNIPGTDSNNWRWRLTADQLSPTLRNRVQQLLVDTGRT